MRALLLVALISAPVAADEVEVDITGQTDGNGPFTASFDIDTLSGPQSYDY